MLTTNDLALLQTEPSELATCFWAAVSDCGPGSVLKAQARKLKTLRHPNVLTYLDSVEVVIFCEVISCIVSQFSNFFFFVETLSNFQLSNLFLKIETFLSFCSVCVLSVRSFSIYLMKNDIT